MLLVFMVSALLGMLAYFIFGYATGVGGLILLSGMIALRLVKQNRFSNNKLNG